MGRGSRKRKAQLQEEEEGDARPQAEAPKADEVEGSAAGRRRHARAAERDQQEEDAPLDPERATKRLAAWAEDPKRQERWLASRGGGLEGHLLEAKGGIVRLRDFLPLDAADCVLRILEGLPEEAWELSEQAGDAGAASHSFWSADVCDVPALGELRSVFWRLLPSFKAEPTLPIFSCGRYAKSDFIGRHDDRAHVPIFGPDNMHSRTVAAIWYLTRDWAEEDGGFLVDLQEDSTGKKGTQHLPVYNSLTVFEVPHWHSVLPVSSDRYRYSIFGWWHQQGKRYELPDGDASAEGVQKARWPKKKRRKAMAQA